ncbi:hypothetical protein N657DRAFT_631690 [Parathielavia appendiculata]|uniref:Heterokaryon incompatibility domain-containing protein n=1 Tax=Parathielavia appendiculata TaxID=2587402 RepID=A0AAN6U8A9_9PEZI|nr:hypothetical protein N657DRAFT_631690 [Parathielavia appendiculata]
MDARSRRVEDFGYTPLSKDEVRLARNIYEALDHLSHEHRDKVLGFDALGIDQDNVQEKEQQVRNMEHIRQEARKVEEIALAKRATAYCGSYKVPWLDFSDAISLYGSSLKQVSFSNNALRRDGQGNILGHRWNVEDLLALLPMFQTQVPHNAIFVILSMASDRSAFEDAEYTSRNKSSSMLFARGAVCAFVSELGDVCENGIIPRNWLEARKDRRGEMPDLCRQGTSGSEYAGSLPDRILRKDRGHLSDYLRRVNACVWGRRFLISTRERHGYYGLVPRRGGPADLICLLEGLRLALPSPGGLSAAAEEKITSSLQKVVAERLSNCAGGRLKRPESSFSEYSPGSVIWGEKIYPNYLINIEGLGWVDKPSEHVLASKFQCIFDKIIRNVLEKGIAAGRVGGRNVGPLVEASRREMLQSALRTFFQDLMDEAVEHPPNASLLADSSAPSLSWADVPVRQLFQALFARACERAFK